MTVVRGVITVLSGLNRVGRDSAAKSRSIQLFWRRAHSDRFAECQPYLIAHGRNLEISVCGLKGPMAKHLLVMPSSGKWRGRHYQSTRFVQRDEVHYMENFVRVKTVHYAVRYDVAYWPKLIKATSLAEAKLLAVGINIRGPRRARFIRVNRFRGNPRRYVALSRDRAYEVCRSG